MSIHHTPGPWKWDPERDTVYSRHAESHGSLICKIATGENEKEENANARLIAAAPDLYQACRAALLTVTDNETGEPIGANWTLAETLKVAIAKAEGK